MSTIAASAIAVSVGTFDGVHRGHRQLLAAAARRAAAAGLPLVVLTLDRHPLSLLRPDRAPRLLTGLDHKLELLAELDGVARTEVLVFDRPRAEQEPASFLRDTLAGELGARLLVVGGNFRFGRDGAGDVSLAARLGPAAGLDVVGLPLLEEAPGAVISSSHIRRLVAAGSLAHAAELLGRPFELRGQLGHRLDGAGGRTPLTVDGQLLLPPTGAYRVRAAPLDPAEGGSLEAAAELSGGVVRLRAPDRSGGARWWHPGAALRVLFGAPAPGTASPVPPASAATSPADRASR